MIRAITRELAGLFVDDGRLAVSIVGWLAIVWLVLPEFGAALIIRCSALFIGLGLILAESSVRQARQRKV